MYKYLLAAALVATALPVLAQVDPSATPTAAAMGRPSMDQMKAKMAEHHAEMVKERDARRADMDAKREKCYQAAQAAKTPEELKSIHEGCRKEGEAMHEQFKGEHKQQRADWKAEHGRMKAAAPAPMPTN